MRIHFELVPESYTGEFPSVTIRHKPSQKYRVEQLASAIEDSIVEIYGSPSEKSFSQMVKNVKLIR